MEMPNIEKELNSEEDAKRRLLTEELARLRAEEENRKSIIEAEGEVSSESPVSNPSLAFLEAIVSQDIKIEDLEKDQLTGALPRSVFIPKTQNILMRLSHIEREGDRRKKKEEPMRVTFIFCDLDYFKEVNSQGGHAFGDQILKEVAAIIKQNIRDTDLICRWGGDEFAIMLPGPDENKAKEIAEKIREAVEKAIIEKYGKLITSLSMGYFVYKVGPGVNGSNVQEEFEKGIKWADAGAYAAKEGGRNRASGTNDLSAGEVEKILQKKEGGATEK